MTPGRGEMGSELSFIGHLGDARYCVCMISFILVATLCVAGAFFMALFSRRQN